MQKELVLSKTESRLVEANRTIAKVLEELQSNSCDESQEDLSASIDTAIEAIKAYQVAHEEMSKEPEKCWCCSGRGYWHVYKKSQDKNEREICGHCKGKGMVRHEKHVC